MKLEQEVLRYSRKNGFPISEFQELTCLCGSLKFHLYSDDEEGGAYVICSQCHTDQDIENSRQYIEEACNNICNCENDHLKVGVGKAFYKDSNELCWVYVGAHCDKCGLAGVYSDWKER